jgi:hypothetical protein
MAAKDWMEISKQAMSKILGVTDNSDAGSLTRHGIGFDFGARPSRHLGAYRPLIWASFAAAIRQ